MASPVTELINLETQSKRQYPGPIDIDSVFETTAARMAFLTSLFRYAGQIVADNEEGKVYRLNAAMNAWVEVGGTDTGTIISDPASPTAITAVWSGSQTQYDELLAPSNSILYFIEE